METNTIKKLRRFNLIMGGLHLVQGIAMLLLATTVIQTISEFSPDILIYYLTYDSILGGLVLTGRILFQLPFGIMVASFLFLSALAHFLIAVPFNKAYEKGLKNNINRFRWIEYALSSSIMIVLISTLFGIYDLASLVLIFIANATMNLFGLLMEEMNGKNLGTGKVNWSPFVYGSIIGLAPWAAIIIYMTGNPALDMVPWFVWAIAGTYFACFFTFPVNMILQYARVGKWKDYLYGERVYIILSLVAKTLLAWLVFFGAMQP